MNELEKLGEASYFFTRMRQERGMPLHFKYNLSAFFSAARSVLQFANKEAKQKNRQDWYVKIMNSEPVLQYFRDMRNVSVHEKSVQPIKAMTALFRQEVTVLDAVTLTILDVQGNVVGHGSSSPSPTPTTPETQPAIISDTYVFQDWKGNEDVFQLAKLYLEKLEELILDGQAKGILGSGSFESS